MKKIALKAALLSMLISVCAAVPACAGIQVVNSETATTSKTVRWWNDDPQAELRWMKGNAGADSFQSAEAAGHGEAEIDLTENGNYTFFSKSGDIILNDVVTITNIDNASPDITLTDLVVNGDDTMDVHYNASDYFSACEVRIKQGECQSSEWDSAKPVSGNVIKNLPTGTYTIFAKDDAGNIGTYLLSESSNASAASSRNTKESSWSDGDREKYFGATGEITMNTTGKASSVVIAKCDSKTGRHIEGAKLQLKEAQSGKVIEEWTTSECDRIFNGLDPDKSYILTELYAPDGYHKAQPVEFYPKHLTGQALVMYDDPKTAVATAPKKNADKHADKPEKLPQTGGFDAQFMLFAAGIIMMLLGAAGLVTIRRKRDGQ